MITSQNFAEVLRRLGFAADLANTWRKSFAHDVTMAVDFENRRLIYPESLKINVHTTTNFDAPENFVVFECVHRLLQKYRQKRLTAKYTVAQRAAELERAWMQYLREAEGDKLYYFMLAASNSAPVVLVKSPADKEGIKKFLGYEWSSRKGNEGIKYLHRTAGAPTPPAASDVSDLSDDLADVPQPPDLSGLASIQTPLFNPQCLDDADKINTLIRAAFHNEAPKISETIAPYVSRAALTDLLDFSRTTFDKSFKTTVTDTKAKVKSKWPLVRLGGDEGACNIRIGGTPSRRVNAYFTGQNLWVSIAEMNGSVITDTKEKITDEAIKNSNVKLIPRGTTLLSFKLSIGKTAIAGADLYTNEAIAALIPKDKKALLDDFLFHLFNSRAINLENVSTKVFGKSLNSDFLKNYIHIPLPPLDIQRQIVAECGQVDAECSAAQQQIEVIRYEMAKAFSDLQDSPSQEMGQIGGFISEKIDIAGLTSKNYVGVDNLLPNTQGKRNSDFVLTAGTATRYVKGDILLSNIRPYLKKIWLADGSGGSSNDVLVYRVKSNNVLGQWVYLILKQDAFFEYEMRHVKGLKMPRGDKKSILRYQVPNPSPPTCRARPHHSRGGEARSRHRHGSAGHCRGT